MFGIFSGNKGYENLNCEDFKNGINSDKDAVVIDVRTAGEFASGHYDKAKNIDIMSGAFNNAVSGFDKNKSYYIYCRSGMRSGKACSILHKNGFEKVYNLKNGIC